MVYLEIIPNREIKGWGEEEGRERKTGGWGKEEPTQGILMSRLSLRVTGAQSHWDLRETA